MATAKITVSARSALNASKWLTEEIEVELAENAAGRVVLHEIAHWEEGGIPSFIPKVRTTAAACGMAGKIEETDLSLSPCNDRTLRQDVTLKGTRKKVQGGVKVDGDEPFRAPLAELWACAWGIAQRTQEVRTGLWNRERDEADARIRAGFPAGSVLMRFSHSEADGWIECWSDPAGRVLRSPKVHDRSGTLGWMSPEDHAAAVAEHDAEKAAEAARAERSRVAEAEREASLATVEVPADAVASYRRYEGDEEAAWDAEDEESWALIRRYAEAIEAQGLGRPGKAVVRRMLRGEVEA